jgi:prephenate dehydrogenase
MDLVSIHGANLWFALTFDPVQISISNTVKVLIKHRASQKNFNVVEKILSCLESKHVHLTWQEHDRITADTQAVTHAAFLRRALNNKSLA